MDGGSGRGGGEWRLITGWLTGESLQNEGTGLVGRVEGSLERQDWKDGMTREILSLKRFAIVLSLAFFLSWLVWELICSSSN